ncbi:DUF4062 domain-containing protein [Hoeflea ulvae]|uniref:DUF4062 domain-containing protein n=1 Tax=Hoeflea ulvae TaxID=2983764 RepID=A0ABT3YHB0_9HYPH|nr:DUF4062 domain-containing protein [Hoeflea ulvae]MCY0095289.1 DUF4062 domain-containing protein [Hoeflea ulvae]
MDNKIYQIFISSTYSDLQEERRTVAEAISKSGQIPAGMEYFPASSQHQFEYIKRIIDRCDYYVLLIAGRYGSLAPSGISYTEEEYRYALSKKIPVLAFLYKNVGKIPSENVETQEDKLDSLERFRTDVASNRIVDFWEDAKELPGKVAISVTQEINLNPGKGWIRGDMAAAPELFTELAELRRENESLKTAKIHQVPSDTAMSSTDRKLALEYEKSGPLFTSISDPKNVRNFAKFEISIKEILIKFHKELIKDNPKIDLNEIIPNYNSNSYGHQSKQKLTDESRDKVLFSLKALNLISFERSHTGNPQKIEITKEGKSALMDIMSE